MKITVLTSEEAEYSNILEGWVNALRSLGNDVVFIDKTIPIFRALSNKPDLFILSIDNFMPGVKKAINSFDIKTVVLTLEQPDGFQISDQVIWASIHPSLQIDNLIHVPIGWDEISFQKDENEQRTIAAVIASQTPAAATLNWLSAHRQYRLYSKKKINVPNYVGSLQRSSKFYNQCHTIYYLDDFSDLANIQACGVELHTSIYAEIDFVPPYKSYIELMQKFLGDIK